MLCKATLLLYYVKQKQLTIILRIFRCELLVKGRHLKTGVIAYDGEGISWDNVIPLQQSYPLEYDWPSFKYT